MTGSEDDARKETTSSGDSEALTPGARLAAQRAAKAAQKAAKKGTAPVVPGGVSERVSQFNELVDRNRKLILGSVVVAAAILFLGAAWSIFSTVTSRKAGKALAQAVSVFSENVRAEKERLADLEDEQPANAKEPDRAKVLQEFKQTVEKHPGSEAARWARLGMAREVYASGKYEEAARAYRAALDAAGDDEFVRSRALEGLGFSLEAEKKYKEALGRYKEMAEVGGGAFKPLAEYHVARIYLAQGDRKRAAIKLNEVVSSLQNKSSENAAASSRYVMFEASARLRELGYTPRRPGATAGRKGSAAVRSRGGEASGRAKPKGDDGRSSAPGSEEE